MGFYPILIDDGFPEPIVNNADSRWRDLSSLKTRHFPIPLAKLSSKIRSLPSSEEEEGRRQLSTSMCVTPYPVRYDGVTGYIHTQGKSTLRMHAGLVQNNIMVRKQGPLIYFSLSEYNYIDITDARLNITRILHHWYKNRFTLQK